MFPTGQSGESWRHRRGSARWGEPQLLPSGWSVRLWTVFQSTHILFLLIRSEQNADTQIRLIFSLYSFCELVIAGRRPACMKKSILICLGKESLKQVINAHISP